MGFSELLLPALGGYWLLTRLNLTRFRATRAWGYRVLFQSALAGVVLYIAAHSAVTLMQNHLPRFSRLAENLQSYLPGDYTDKVVLSIALGFVIPLLLNLLFRAKPAARAAAKIHGDFIELLISDAVDGQELIEVTLESGKCYIGIAVESGIESYSEGHGDLSLIPMASGYRDNNTRELVITTDYASVINQSFEDPEDLELEDFRVVVPMERIQSARLFRPEVYELFWEQGLASSASVSSQTQD